jgi:triacylglycerol lipase
MQGSTSGRNLLWTVLAASGLAGALVSCSSDLEQRRVVVIVSGVLSYSPFTTPDEACTEGFAAGNTDTFLREYLINEGFEVFTMPQRIGDGVVSETDDPAEGPFGGCPAALPASVTLDTTSTFEVGGEKVRAFVEYLHDEYGVTAVDLVAHSTGGPWSRAGIAALEASDSPVEVTSLATVGSPWESPMIAKPIDPANPASSCDGAPVCEAFAQGILDYLPGVAPLVEQMGPGYAEWSASLDGSLDGIPVTLVAGTYFAKDGGDRGRWPNDAVVHEDAATAVNVPDTILSLPSVHVFDNVHSLFVARLMGLPDEQSLTWNPAVGKAIADGIRRSAG